MIHIEKARDVENIFRLVRNPSVVKARIMEKIKTARKTPILPSTIMFPKLNFFSRLLLRCSTTELSLRKDRFLPDVFKNNSPRSLREILDDRLNRMPVEKARIAHDSQQPTPWVSQYFY
ncbi:hypothetical protein [Marispirochaeta aestuarii]|uniref:hypothetical protein n=1 Tax=Marispirochaeta aestuarii TaxID=1963862 RepID=UPI0029C7E93A|nr:hypothetical protein [Marispirochaeta aestuarii]